MLSKKLGEGGMGSVYAGQHVATGRMVAVKILHSELIANEELVHRFIREAQAEVAINHKNVIDVLDLGALPSGEPYMVMEYLVGAGLDEIITAQKQLDLPTACAIMAQTLHAISAAHDKGVVHRDLKPENIFINCPDDNTLEIKLIDFGISKIQNQDVTKLTQEGTTLGTPAYMSPEQVRGANEMNHLTDIYAAGIIFYEMLSGDTPFEGKQYAALLANILTSEPRHPQSVCRHFPMTAWPVIQKAIAKDPAERYQNAEEMLSAVLRLSEEVERIKGLAALPAAIALANSDKSIPPHLALMGDLNNATELLAELSHQNAEATAETILQSRSKNDRETTAGRRTKTTKTGVDISDKRTASAEMQSKLRTTAATIRNELTERPRKKKKGVAAVIFFAIAILAGLAFAYKTTGIGDNAASDNQITIEIVGAPRMAHIYYNDQLMSENPFDVAIRQKWTPIRIDVGKRTRMRFVVKPNRNMRIQYVAGETSAQMPKDSGAASASGKAGRADASGRSSQTTQAASPSASKATVSAPPQRSATSKPAASPKNTSASKSAGNSQKSTAKKKTTTKSNPQKSAKTSQKKKPQAKTSGTAQNRSNGGKKRANPFRKLKNEIKKAFKD